MSREDLAKYRYEGEIKKYLTQNTDRPGFPIQGA